MRNYKLYKEQLKRPDRPVEMPGKVWNGKLSRWEKPDPRKCSIRYEAIEDAVNRMPPNDFNALRKEVLGIKTGIKFIDAITSALERPQSLQYRDLVKFIQFREEYQALQGLPVMVQIAIMNGEKPRPDWRKTPEDFEIVEIRKNIEKHKELDAWKIARAKQQAQIRINEIIKQVKSVESYDVRRIRNKTHENQFVIEVYKNGDFKGSVDVNLDSFDRDQQIDNLENSVRNFIFKDHKELTAERQ